MDGEGKGGRIWPPACLGLVKLSFGVAKHLSFLPGDGQAAASLTAKSIAAFSIVASHPDVSIGELGSFWAINRLRGFWFSSHIIYMGGVREIRQRGGTKSPGGFILAVKRKKTGKEKRATKIITTSTAAYLGSASLPPNPTQMVG